MLTFDQTIPTSLSATHVWDLFAQSFLDSRKSPLWPDAMETLKGDSFERGAIISATYKLGPVKMPQSYRLTRCDVETRELIYRTRPGHPLIGGGHVTISPYGEGCRIHWRGAYAKKFSLTSVGAALFTQHYFEARFFDAIKRNLRHLEYAMAKAAKTLDTQEVQAPNTRRQRAS